MKSKLRKMVIPILILLGLILSVQLISSFNNQPFITSKVKRNLTTLTEVVDRIMEAENANDYSFEGVKQINYWKRCNMVEFVCRSFRIGSSTSYYGFYFSQDDIPLGFQGAELNFIEEGSGWKWEETNGDNSCYTEKITDNWYYFEIHF